MSTATTTTVCNRSDDLSALNITTNAEVITRACHANTQSAFPDSYESVACQAVCGTGNESNFFTNECVQKFVTYCLNGQDKTIDISTGNIVSAASTTGVAFTSQREDERSMRNFPILYSRVCQAGLITLLTNASRIGNDDTGSFVRETISTRLREFCDPGRNRVFDNIIAPPAYSFTDRGAIPFFDESKMIPITNWVVASDDALFGVNGTAKGETVDQFLQGQLKENSGTYQSKSGSGGVMTGVLKLDKVDGIQPVPTNKTEDNCRKLQPYSTYGTFDFIATSYIIAPSGFSYIELMKLYKDLTYTAIGSITDCNFTNARASDAFVLRAKNPVDVSMMLNGVIRPIKFMPELRAKIIGIDLATPEIYTPQNAAEAAVFGSKYTTQRVTLQLSNIYVNTPYLMLYESLNCGGFVPFDTTGKPNMTPDSLNDPKCSPSFAGIPPETVETSRKICRVGWNQIPFRPVGSTANTYLPFFEAFFYRDVSQSHIKIKPAKSESLVESSTLGKGYTGAISINSEPRANLIREICACHLPQSRYDNFQKSVDEKGISIGSAEKNIRCAFPGCVESRFPSFDIAADRNNGEGIGSLNVAIAGRINNCPTDQCIQSCSIADDGSIINAKVVNINVSQACNGISTIATTPVPEGDEDAYGKTSHLPVPRHDKGAKNVVIIATIGASVFIIIVIIVIAFFALR
jgi:hypothetical protein